MTEAAMAFKDDVRIRSNIKKSAAYKKNGSATQKLGNRRMTWQEISEKHGPVSEWCLKDFVDYSAFVQMPHDIQIEYVNKLCDEYDVGLQHLSQFLFNKGGDGLRAYLRNNKILDKCNPQKSRGKTGLNRFKDDILDWKRRSAATEVPELPVEEETEQPPLRVGWSPLYEVPRVAETLGIEPDSSRIRAELRQIRLEPRDPKHRHEQCRLVAAYAIAVVKGKMNVMRSIAW